MNENTRAFDTVILGQGLAGSLLGWQLIQQGQQILVIDNGHTSSASRVAAGLVNPVTGQRLVKTAHVDEYLPVARLLYKTLEEYFDRCFFHPKEMLRIFRSENEKLVWEKRKKDTAYQAYLGDQFEPNQHTLVQDPLGSFKQLHTGYLDTVFLLDALRDYFQSTERYLKSTIDYRDIKIQDNCVRINDINTRRLIFCEGYKATENPWFSWLPFKPAKGEILTLTTDEPIPIEIINAAKWLVPLSENQFKLGATYQWQPLDEQPTEEAKDELIAALNKILKQLIIIDVTEHKAGVRPCTKDTAPFIGLHPEYKQLGIFNGFGSKGSLVIPYQSKRFSDYLQGTESIMPETDIQRYYGK